MRRDRRPRGVQPIGEICAGHDVPAARVLDVLGILAKHGAAEAQLAAAAVPGEETRRSPTLPPPRCATPAAA